MARFQLTDCTAKRAPGRLIRRIEKIVSGMVEQRLEREHTPINFSQWAALKMVWEGLATTAGELATQLGHTTGATTRLIDGLETPGLLVRDRGAADRRVVRLSVTPRGETMIASIHPIVLDVWNELLVDFDQEEADRFVASLAKLLDAAEAKAARPALAEAAE